METTGFMARQSPYALGWMLDCGLQEGDFVRVFHIAKLVIIS